MTLFDQLKAGAEFRPTAELIRSCEAAIVARAFVGTRKPIVEGYQKAILAAGDYWMCDQWRESFKDAEVDPGKFRITEPDRTYLLPAAAAERYHEACKQAAKDAGLYVSREGNCPLLEAKHLLIQAENSLLEVFAAEMEVPTLANPIQLDHRERLLELIFGLMAPLVGDAEQVLGRCAA